MKHIFLIHSHITFYISKNVQLFYKIPKENIFYIIARNYHNKYFEIPKSQILTKSRNDLYSPVLNKNFSFIQKINFLFFKNHFSDIPINIKSFMNAHPYILYTPIVSPLIIQALAFHNNCNQLHFIEEGFASYINGSKISLGSKKRLLLFFQKLNPFSTYQIHPHNQYAKIFKFKRINAYTFNNLCFKNNKSVITKSIPFYKSLLKSKLILPNNANLFIFDGITKYHAFSFVTLKSVVEKIVKRYIQNSLYLKFHPSQSLKEKKEIITTLKKHIKIFVIGDDEPLEVALLKLKNLNLYGFHSSLLFYALLYSNNHHVYSFEKILGNVNKTYSLSKTYLSFLRYLTPFKNFKEIVRI